ncbi:MAG: hypothetical protein AAF723_01535, partial [Pseudomonadota bacterium]
MTSSQPLEGGDLNAKTPSGFAEILSHRLKDLRQQIRHDPLRNPVRELAHELSRHLQANDISLSSFHALIDFLDKEAFARRADHINHYVKTSDNEENSPIKSVVETLSAELTNIDDFRQFWQARRETIIFTGHPTFILSQQARKRLAEAATERAVPSQGAGMPDSPLTLDHEHSQAEESLRHASEALFTLNREILNLAKSRFPGEWLSVKPEPLGLGTWVGYDMDGRTDIGWASVIRHRLEEKRNRLRLYIERLGAVENDVEPIKAELEKALNAVEQHYLAFSKDLKTPKDLAYASNLLTTDQHNITSLKSVINQL